MHEDPQAPGGSFDFTLKDYLRILSARRWWLIFIVGVGVTVTAIINFKTPNIFRATATLQINKATPNVVAMKEVMDLQNLEGSEFLQTQHKILQSRTIAERVIKRLELEKHPEFNGQGNGDIYGVSGIIQTLTRLISGWLSPDQASSSADGKRDLVEIYYQHVKINPIRQTLLVEVSAALKDKKLVATIANTHAEEYVGYTLGERLGITGEASESLQQQSKDLQAKLDKSEQALQAYRESHGLVSLEERQNIVVEKLKRLNEQVIDAKKDRITAENAYTQLEGVKEKGGDPSSLPFVIQDKVVQNLKEQISEKTANVAKLQERYLEKYPALIEARSELDGVQRQLKLEVEKLTATIENDYQLALSREKNLAQALAEQEKAAMDLNEKSIGYDTLKRQAETDRQLFESVLGRMKELGVSKTLDTTNVSILDRAFEPSHRYRPRRALNIMLAFLLSLLGGSVFCFVLESLTETVRGPEDLAERFGVPFLGYVPHLPWTTSKKGVEASQNANSAFAEAFRTACAVLSLQPKSAEAKYFIVTSAAPNEGKSTCAKNLAATFAQKNLKTLLIEADLRRPVLCKDLGLLGGGGLELLGNGKMDFDTLVRSTPIPNFHVVASPVASHPERHILSTPHVREFLLNMRQHFDRIVIDTPPLGAVSDALSLCSLADGFIWVVRFDTVRKKVVMDAFAQLLQIKAKVFGVLINDIDLAKQHNQYYYSYRSYGAYHENGGKKGEGKTVGG